MYNNNKSILYGSLNRIIIILTNLCFLYGAVKLV